MDSDRHLRRQATYVPQTAHGFQNQTESQPQEWSRFRQNHDFHITHNTISNTPSSNQHHEPQTYNLSYNNENSQYNPIRTSTGLPYDYVGTDPNRVGHHTGGYPQFDVVGFVGTGLPVYSSGGVVAQNSNNPNPPYDPSEDGFPIASQPRSSAIEVLSNQFVMQSSMANQLGTATGYYGDSLSSNPHSTQPESHSDTYQQPTGLTYTHADPVNEFSYSSLDPPTGPYSSKSRSSTRKRISTFQVPKVSKNSTNSSNNSMQELDLAFEQYVTEIFRTFEYVRQGRLLDAGQNLLDVAEWLLGNAESLGLNRDDEGVQAERSKLWGDFNTCWLVTLQKQKDLSIELKTNPLIQNSVTILERQYLETMGSEIVRLSDMVEKHGLVDYQMGLWEEQIISLLIECIQVFAGENKTESRILPPGLESRSTGPRSH